jgi:hypothetical protein
VESGAVSVLNGAAGGLTATNNQLWNQDSIGADVAEAGDRFGAGLAAADFNGDMGADLAVGVTGEDLGTVADAGAVHVASGTAPWGLNWSGSQFWHQDSPGVVDDAEAGDRFGSALAAGEFNGGLHAHLAVGVTGEDVGPWSMPAPPSSSTAVPPRGSGWEASFGTSTASRSSTTPSRATPSASRSPRR